VGEQDVHVIPICLVPCSPHLLFVPQWPVPWFASPWFADPWRGDKIPEKCSVVDICMLTLFESKFPIKDYSFPYYSISSRKKGCFDCNAYVYVHPYALALYCLRNVAFLETACKYLVSDIWNTLRGQKKDVCSVDLSKEPVVLVKCVASLLKPTFRFPLSGAVHLYKRVPSDRLMAT